MYAVWLSASYRPSSLLHVLTEELDRSSRDTGNIGNIEISSNGRWGLVRPFHGVHNSGLVQLPQIIYLAMCPLTRIRSTNTFSNSIPQQPIMIGEAQRRDCRPCQCRLSLHFGLHKSPTEQQLDPAGAGDQMISCKLQSICGWRHHKWNLKRDNSLHIER